MRVIVFLSLLVVSCTAWADSPPYWPLAKGTYWVYEGDVSWVERNAGTGQNEVRQAHVTWRSEVTDCIVVQGVSVALLHGSPFDLTWSDSTRLPKDLLLLKVGPDYYRVTKNAVAIFARIKAAQAYAPPQDAGAPEETSELLLAGPLAPGKKFGMGDSLYELFRDRYCELVEGPLPFDLRTIRGAPPIDHPQFYSISCHTSPDNDEIDFLPGLGITAYTYHHHGTTMDVDLALKEFGVRRS